MLLPDEQAPGRFQFTESQPENDAVQQSSTVHNLWGEGVRDESMCPHRSTTLTNGWGEGGLATLG
jgi:hypothetical protein